MPTMEEAALGFLMNFKAIIAHGRGLDIVPREENNQTIVELGLTKRNVESEILGLSVLDYCSGPENDRSRPGVIWVFGKVIMKCEVYIKLKIVEVDGVKIAKCISFHKANHKINYPLRK